MTYSIFLISFITIVLSCNKNSPNFKTRKSLENASNTADALNDEEANSTNSEPESRIQEKTDQTGIEVKDSTEATESTRAPSVVDGENNNADVQDEDNNDTEAANKTKSEEDDNKEDDLGVAANAGEKGAEEESEQINKSPFYLQYMDSSGQYYISVLEDNSIVSTVDPKTVWKLEAIDDEWGGAYLKTETTSSCIYVRVGDRGDYGRVIPCEGTNSDAGFITPTRFKENKEEKKFGLIYPNLIGRTEDCLYVYRVDAYEDKPLYMGRVVDCNSDSDTTIFRQDLGAGEETPAGESDTADTE